MQLDLITSERQWTEVVVRLLNSEDPFGNRVIGYDTETLDYGWPNITVTGFSLAWYDAPDEINGCYVPLNHVDTDIDQLSFSQIYEDLAKILESDKIEVTAHNIKYDRNVNFLYPEPIDMSENVFDTMIAAWLINTPGVGTQKQRESDHGYHGLKPWIKDKFGYEMAELNDFCEKVEDEAGNKVFLTHKVDPAHMAPYAIDDAIYTLKLRQWIMANKFIGREEGLWDIYNKLERKFIFVLGDIEKWGMEVDEESLREMGEEIKAEIDRIHKKMYELRPVADFENDNPKDIQQAAKAYEELEHEEDLSPYEKGQQRKSIFMATGLEDHPVEEKIRDDNLRPEVIKWPELAHKIFNPNSTHQLNEVLFEECELEPIGDRSEKSGLYSTSKDNISKWAQEHPIAEELNRLRILTKLDGTYIDGILHRISDDHRVRTRYNMVIATGRLSSRDPNLQNIVKSDEFPVRKVFVGSDCSRGEVTVYAEDAAGDPEQYELSTETGGFTIENSRLSSWYGDNPPWPIIVADYGQLELRILAHYADDETMKQTFAEGRDIHSATAKRVFDLDCDVDEVRTKYGKKRDEVKAVEYGTLYGAGGAKIGRTLGISEEEGEEIRSNYLNQFSSIKEWIEKQHNFVNQHGYVETLAGRKRHLPGAFLNPWEKGIDKEERRRRWKIQSAAERRAVNTPIQGSAADIINKAMVDIREYCKNTLAYHACDFQPPKESVEHSMDFHTPLWGNWIRMLVQVHDEIIFEMHPSIANWSLDKMTDIMANSFELSVPLTVDAGIGYNWQQTKE